MCQTIPAFHSTICHAMVLSQAQEQVYYIYFACSVFSIAMNLVIWFVDFWEENTNLLMIPNYNDAVFLI